MSNDYHDGLQERFDDDGYLLKFEDWSIGVAEHLAKEERVEMTEGHWEVVIFLREYYKEYKSVPMIKTLAKAIAKKLGPEKGNTKHLLELYWGGAAKQGSIIAGLPQSRGD